MTLDIRCPHCGMPGGVHDKMCPRHGEDGRPARNWEWDVGLYPVRRELTAEEFAVLHESLIGFCPECSGSQGSHSGSCPRRHDDAPVGDRFNTGKPKLYFNTLGREVQAGEAAVWEFGATKYSPGNWLKGMSWVGCSDSILRHLIALLNGEDNDPETGLPHADHIVCCAKILSNSFHTRKDLDDRPGGE